MHENIKRDLQLWADWLNARDRNYSGRIGSPLGGIVGVRSKYYQPVKLPTHKTLRRCPGCDRIIDRAFCRHCDKTTSTAPPDKFTPANPSDGRGAKITTAPTARIKTIAAILDDMAGDATLKPLWEVIQARYAERLDNVSAARDLGVSERTFRNLITQALTYIAGAARYR